MDEAQVFIKHGKVDVRFHRVPIPKPGPSQVLIKVVASRTNPKDWKFPRLDVPVQRQQHRRDIAGYIHEVDEGVVGFKVSGRVAAFHDYMTPHGSYAEYISESYATFHIPGDDLLRRGGYNPSCGYDSVVSAVFSAGIA